MSTSNLGSRSYKRGNSPENDEGDSEVLLHMMFFMFGIYSAGVYLVLRRCDLAENVGPRLRAQSGCSMFPGDLLWMILRAGDLPLSIPIPVVPCRMNDLVEYRRLSCPNDALVVSYRKGQTRDARNTRRTVGVRGASIVSFLGGSATFISMMQYECFDAF